MYALLSDQEIVQPFVKQTLLRELTNADPSWRWLTKTSAHRPVDYDKLLTAAIKDLTEWKDSVISEYKSRFRETVREYADSIDILDISKKELIENCVENLNHSLIKILAYQLTSYPRWVDQKADIQLEETILIRNILGNEELLSARINKQYPFWFIDSGYTNFLTKRKQWHRLVQNHIHHRIDLKYFPADRLSRLTSTPQPWRRTGKKILVVESSELHYKLFGTTLEEWRSRVRNQLKEHTDRPVEFKEKDLDRKTRTSVYELLQTTDEYYCVVSDASAAAIEAIWCGVPAITLNTHISNPVTRSKISDIDNLYRGPIGDWLCALTYSQFTLEEFESGYALEMLGTYHGITI